MNWADGTIKSQNNAFTAHLHPTAEQLIKRKKHAAVQAKTRERMKAEALRVNPESQICAPFQPKSIRSPR